MLGSSVLQPYIGDGATKEGRVSKVSTDTPMKSDEEGPADAILLLTPTPQRAGAKLKALKVVISAPMSFPA